LPAAAILPVSRKRVQEVNMPANPPVFRFAVPDPQAVIAKARQDRGGFIAGWLARLLQKLDRRLRADPAPPAVLPVIRPLQPFSTPGWIGMEDLPSTRRVRSN
jgi:hypothetical protein